MKKILLIALMAACVSATSAPILAKVLGFGATAAYAGPFLGDQGEDDDAQGDNDNQ
jgi:hypothetical protein